MLFILDEESLIAREDVRNRCGQHNTGDGSRRYALEQVGLLVHLYLDGGWDHADRESLKKTQHYEQIRSTHKSSPPLM